MVRAGFRRVPGASATGVTVITAPPAAPGPAGFACRPFSSLSPGPPPVCFLAGRTSTTWPRIPLPASSASAYSPPGMTVCTPVTTAPVHTASAGAVGVRLITRAIRAAAAHRAPDAYQTMS